MNKLKVYKDITELCEIKWQHLVTDSRYFLSYQYLSTLQQANPNIQYRYVVLTVDDQYRAVASFQIADFKGEFLRKYVPESSKVLNWILNRVLDMIDSKLIALGNLIFTCEPGWYISSLYTDTTHHQLLLEMIASVEREFENQTVGIMISEELHRDNRNVYLDKGFHIFEVENKMVFRQEVDSLEDYRHKISSKYRVRMNKVYKLNENVNRIIIDIQNFDLYANSIQHLFRNVVNQSKFKLLDIDSNYFRQYLMAQPDKFKIIGFVENNVLIGFVSYFDLSNEIEVHYIGLDYHKNETQKIYNYMLYQMLELGLNRGIHHICMGRTAQEIKSTIGATPTQVYSYLKINNRWLNHLTPYFLSKLVPEKWVARDIWKHEATQ